MRFETGDDVDVSVPWTPVAGSVNEYELRDSPESAMAPAAFGDFDYFEATIPGATLRITLLKPDSPIDSEAIVDWVASAAANINLVYDEFPNPSPHVVVIPVGSRAWSNSPVPFGRVVRDGGETVELFVNEYRSVDDYYGNWTATHEFSHLMIPYIRSRHRWVSEGFAQYYQNVLLARAGIYSEQRAWDELVAGFERGRNSAPEKSPNEAAEQRGRGATMKIYWSGAVLALLADVELRRRSNGEESLDTVMQQLSECCLPSDRMWTGTELYSRLDDMLDEPVFMPLYRRYADATGFPDARPMLARLGVVTRGDSVSFDNAAELAGLRQAITNRREND